ncbi:SAM-dependent methyltransferase [Nocardia asteroides]|uniref:SAM-dependent methyltransferase n=1 Tax=Nocardia asteroides TaxID=1824 RepID=UPI001E2FA8E2|nr:SAM-dependent methyltransferase [Nocardia asteroides]UGT59873.1 SAM-dependent methyltransferase [Nocardia asteroides]
MVDSPPDLGVNRAHTARVCNHLLGGKDFYDMDKDAAEQVLAAFSSARIAAWENRAFMARYARYLALAGIHQFLDIGCGIPHQPNLHEIVQEVNPGARVVYVDNDPIVLAHARALLVGTSEGRITCIDADLTDSGSILTAPELTDTLDLSEPVGVSLGAILHFLGDEEMPYEIVAALRRGLASGSYLGLSHATADFDEPGTAAVVQVYRKHGIEVRPRTRDEVAQFLTGLDIVGPGIVPAHRWRPDNGEEPTRGEDVASLAAHLDARVSLYAGVGRIPQVRR